MEAKKDKIIESETTETIVYDYEPRQFQIGVSESAQEFIDIKHEESQDFELSDLAAQQAGIAKINRERMNRRIEELSLEKLKEIQESAYKEAYDLGVVEGTEKAFVDMREEFNERLVKMDNLLLAFDDIKRKILEHNEVFFTKLLFLIGKKIAYREIKENPEQMMDLIRQLIEELHGEERIVVRMNDEDMFYMENLREKGVKESEELKNVKMEIGEGIVSGGCLLETNYGVIDATLERRVEKVWSLLENRLPRLSEDERQLSSEELSDEPQEASEEISKNSENKLEVSDSQTEESVEDSNSADHESTPSEGESHGESSSNDSENDEGSEE